MPEMSRKLMAAAFAGLLMLGAGACSDDDDAETDTTEEVEDTESTDTTDTTDTSAP